MLSFSVDVNQLLEHASAFVRAYCLCKASFIKGFCAFKFPLKQTRRLNHTESSARSKYTPLARLKKFKFWSTVNAWSIFCKKKHLFYVLSGPTWYFLLCDNNTGKYFIQYLTNSNKSEICFIELATPYWKHAGLFKESFFEKNPKQAENHDRILSLTAMTFKRFRSCYPFDMTIVSSMRVYQHCARRSHHRKMKTLTETCCIY